MSVVGRIVLEISKSKKTCEMKTKVKKGEFLEISVMVGRSKMFVATRTHTTLGRTLFS